MYKEHLKLICNEYEKKLIELMGMKEFTKFSEKIAKTLLLADIQAMPDGEFKDFCIKNFSNVTKEVDNAIDKIYGDN